MRVNMDSSVASDPRFKLVAQDLGRPWREVVGSCFLVWLACYERRSAVLPVDEVDLAAEIPGFSAALARRGLADVGANSVEIHGVQQRIEFLIEQSEKGARGGSRSAKSRRNKSKLAQAEREANAQAKASGVAQAEPEAYSHTHTHDLDHTHTPPLAPSSSEALVRRDPETVNATAIPTTKSLEYVPTPADLAEWSTAYPAVDVPQQLRAMRQWCLANPKRLKTPTGVRTFIAGWLNREQNRGGSQRADQAPQREWTQSQGPPRKRSLYRPPEGKQFETDGTQAREIARKLAESMQMENS